MLTDGCQYGRLPGPLGLCVDEELQGGTRVSAFEAPPAVAPALPAVELIEPEPVSGWVIVGSTSRLQMRDFSDRALVEETPSVSDVRQGFTGNCPVIATLAALAHARPGQIAGMVSRREADVSSKVWDTSKATAELSPTPRKTRFLYEVTFAAGTPIPVSGLLWQQDGVIEYGQSARGDLWTSILEKAYVVEHGGHSYQRIFGTVFPDEAMENILGSAQELTPVKTAAGLKDVLKNAKSKPTIAATFDGLPAEVEVPEGIIGNHAYAVLGLIGNDRVRVYNALDGATIDVPLATFRKVFETVVQSN